MRTINYEGPGRFEYYRLAGPVHLTLVAFQIGDGLTVGYERGGGVYIFH